jgi:hypothetical protein
MCLSAGAQAWHPERRAAGVAGLRFERVDGGGRLRRAVSVATSKPGHCRQASVIAVTRCTLRGALLSRRSASRLLCGVIGPPLFILAFLVEGATRNGYDPIRLPISLLSLGEAGWTQTANFIVDGALLFLAAIGLRRRLPRSARATA